MTDENSMDEYPWCWYIAGLVCACDSHKTCWDCLIESEKQSGWRDEHGKEKMIPLSRRDGMNEARKIDVQKMVITLTHEQLKILAELYLQYPDVTSDVHFLMEPTAHHLINLLITEEEDARPLIFCSLDPILREGESQ